MSYSHPVPSCMKTIYLSDLLKEDFDENPFPKTNKKHVKKAAFKASTADTLKKSLEKQAAAMLASTTSLLRTVNASVSQLKVTSMSLGMDLQKQRKTLDELSANYSALSQYHLIKKLKDPKLSKKPVPEGMYS